MMKTEIRIFKKDDIEKELSQLVEAAVKFKYGDFEYCKKNN